MRKLATIPAYLVIGVTLGLSTVLVVSSSPTISATNGAILKSLGVDDSEIDKLLNGEDTENIPEKGNGDVEMNKIEQRDPEWWRDPLALFEDSEDEDEDDTDMEDDEDEESYASYDVTSGSELDIETEDEVDSCPVITPLEDEEKDELVEEVPETNEKEVMKLEEPSKKNESEKEKTEKKETKDTRSLPMDAQRRLAQHSILMKPEASPSSKVIEKSNTNFSAPALPAILVISKLRSILPGIPPNVVTLFVSLAGTQFIATRLFPRKKRNLNQYAEDDDPLGDDYTLSGKNFLSKIMKNLQPSGSSTKMRSKDERSSDENNVSSQGLSTKPGWVYQEKKNSEDSKQKKIRRVSKMEMLEEMEHWRDRAEKAEIENEELIVESERVTKELAKVRSESSNLRNSMQYLKSQLLENQNEMEKAVKQERKKSEKEMTEVREALLKVLRHERNLMREQVQKTSAQVRALLKEEAQQKHEEE